MLPKRSVLLKEFREGKAASSWARGVVLKGATRRWRKDHPEQQKGHEQGTEADRVLLSWSIQPEALCRTPADWLITSVHPAECRGINVLAQLPSALIKGQCREENSL